MSIFKQLKVRGAAGSLLWGFADAAKVRTWTISRQERDWRLVAAVERVDAFRVRQRPLRFTAPRKGGFWCWPVIGAVQVDGKQLTARLGQPEQ